jgi:hypothetical protein
MYIRKGLDEYYWFTSFDDLSRNHYPADARWVFDPGYTKEKYAANPYYSPDIISSIKLLSPGSGVISARVGDTIHFTFVYSGGIEHLQINSNVWRNLSIWETKGKHRRRTIQKLDTFAIRKQQYVPFKQNNGTYEFDYVATSASLEYLDVLVDYKRVMRFNVVMNSFP